MKWDWNYAREVWPVLLGGLWITLQATAMASVIALVAGLPLAIARTSRSRSLSLPVTAFIEVIRGTPLLIQLFFLFYVLPEFGIRASPLITGVVGLGVNYSSYTSEVYRAGIQDVPRGQWDACSALNLPLRRVWLNIVMPQAIIPILPALGNYVVMMLKESALLSAITVQELTFEARQVGSHGYRFLEPIAMMAFMYLVVSYAAATILRPLERLVHASR